MAGFHFALGFRKRKGGCPSYTPGLYTAEEIDTLVNVDGYIPVASAAEFELIDSGVSETMGAGTCWEGNYTTGIANNYIQVEAIDWSGEPSRTTSFQLNGIYDGNELPMSNYTGSVELFGTTTGTVRNVRQNAVNISAAKINIAAICGVLDGGTISNCRVSGTITNTFSNTGGIFGQADLTYTVTNCINNATINGASTYTGGIGGFSNNTSTGTITNCTNNGNVSSAGSQVAGICCNLTGRITITGCTNTGDVSGATLFVGGITTYIYNAADIISDCVVENCSISGAGGTNSVRMGGICYFRLGGIVEDCRIENVSFSNPATGSLSTLGGIAGTMFQGVNIIRRCEVINCTIDGGATGDRVGGIVGFSRSGSTSNLVKDCRVVGGSINGDNLVGGIWGHMALAVDDIENSFCAVAVTGNTNEGGLVGLGVAGATATDSYWDTTVGPATSSKGTGQTTSALQTPTSPTGIYASWNSPPWDFGTSSDYPTLTTTP